MLGCNQGAKEKKNVREERKGEINYFSQICLEVRMEGEKKVTCYPSFVWFANGREMKRKICVIAFMS